jgi:hypothetical protein
VEQEAVDDLLARARLMFGIVDRAKRAWRLGEWALLHRVRGDDSISGPDPLRFVPDKGSSLALDDAGFMREIAATMLPLADEDKRLNLVSTTARFPAMTAAENLVGAVQVHGAALQERRTSNVSIGTLCRSAIENAAKTIWLLCDTDREVRRARCLGYTRRVNAHIRRAISRSRKRFTACAMTAPPSVREVHADEGEVREASRTHRGTAPRQAHQAAEAFERIVKRAAEWIDENPPPHITEADGLQHGMTPWRATVLCVRIELRAWIQVDE